MFGTSQDFYLTGEGHTEVLAGVYHKGIMYYDFSKVKFINNSGIADIIDLVKSWIDLGAEVRFTNVSEEIKRKLRESELEGIIDFE
jgi:anti-anti-sigma regulatory factor